MLLITRYLILLDEANLSPIEHYWASFLKNCDFASSANRSISLGGNNRFSLPEHLRFLATVNFDHTTEELSPRFLDRSWIITLEPTRIDDEIEEDLENYEDMVSFDSLKTAFCVSEEDVIDESIANKWNAIQSIFRSEQCSLPIMPRNLSDSTFCFPRLFDFEPSLCSVQRNYVGRVLLPLYLRKTLLTNAIAPRFRHISF